MRLTYRLACQTWLLGVVLLGTPAAAMADSPPEPPAPETVVMLVETDEAQCLVNDGKLISLALKDATQPVEVWIDRWFMQVQTADHTKHVLSPQHPEVELGCSRSNAGPQHWTIHHVTLLPLPAGH